ncbi:MAG: ABC transporter permease subunit [Finegoldia magna]|uniref:PstA family ABC transporter permease n=1 Tax=Finegoldia magna TaxID=1260 RepID=UPI000B918B42|nr:ABC transporter permease subunit [Finegoldia magna]MDU7926025.1 ABC transporter permease subunit [Finegoldia magna]OXZ40211.1 phosphate ABC transporter permease [Finegoldia magna]
MTKFKDFLIKLWVYLSFAVVFFFVFKIFYFLISKEISSVNLEFLTQNPQGLPLGTTGGIKSSIIGSFWLMIIAMGISTLLGVFCAIYRVFYCKSEFLKSVISLIIQCIASIPSIIIGMFVYGFFIVTLDISKSLLTASIALSLIVFPFVEVNIEKSIAEINKNTIKDSFSLGIDKTYMIRKLIMPMISRNIITISLLAGSYAIGATAPLLLTGAVFMNNSVGLFKPVTALPFHLHMLLSQSIAIEKAYATALVLIMILIILHILAYVVLVFSGGKIVEHITNK